MSPSLLSSWRSVSTFLHRLCYSPPIPRRAQYTGASRALSESSECQDQAVARSSLALLEKWKKIVEEDRGRAEATHAAATASTTDSQVAETTPAVAEDGRYSHITTIGALVDAFPSQHLRPRSPQLSAARRSTGHAQDRRSRPRRMFRPGTCRVGHRSRSSYVSCTLGALNLSLSATQRSQSTPCGRQTCPGYRESLLPRSRWYYHSQISAQDPSSVSEPP